MHKKIFFYSLLLFFCFCCLTGWFFFFPSKEKVDSALKISILSDVHHCPERSPVSIEFLNNFIFFSQKKKSDFIVSLGDNASHRLGECSRTADLDARFIVEHLQSAGLPVHLVLGDHDLDSSLESYHNWQETSRRQETYYSFNLKDVHIIILDTVLGGEEMASSCEEDIACSDLENRLSELKNNSYFSYRKRHPDSVAHPNEEKSIIKEKLVALKKDKSLTRSSGLRDKGRLSEKQLAWLAEDIHAAQQLKVLIFSDHPLFPFSSTKKSYDVFGSENAREILEKSGKKIVAISGEAHLWHEEELNGIHYYIVDEFNKLGGSWAYFTWKDDFFQMEKIIQKL